jgi:hypothetical protein
MTRPITPFLSTDPRMAPERAQPSDQQEQKLCECISDVLALEEVADNKCETCRRPLIVWVATEDQHG